MAKRPRWTWEEDRILEDLYPTLSANELSLILGRPPEGIRYRACRLGVEAVKRNGFVKYGKDQYERAITLYARMPAREVGERMGISTDQAKYLVRNAPRALAQLQKDNIVTRRMPL